MPAGNGESDVLGAFSPNSMQFLLPTNTGNGNGRGGNPFDQLCAPSHSPSFGHGMRSAVVQFREPRLWRPG